MSFFLGIILALIVGLIIGFVGCLLLEKFVFKKHVEPVK